MTDTWFWVAFAALICALAAIIALYFRTIVPMKKLRDLTARLDSSDAEALRREAEGIPGTAGEAARNMLDCMAAAGENASVEEERPEEEPDYKKSVVNEICSSLLPQAMKNSNASLSFALTGGIMEGKRRACAFYDHFFLDGNTLCFAVGEVPGSGIAEALFSVVAQTTIRSRLRMGRSLTDTMSDVNSQLFDLTGKHTAHVIVCVLNVMNGRLTFVNAGGTTPVLMRSEGRYEWLNTPVYAALGANESVSYRAEALRLNQGDHMFLFTSELGEIKNRDEQRFDDQAILTVLNRSRTMTGSTEELIPFVKNEVAAFCESSDDMLNAAAIALEYKKGNRDFIFTLVRGTPEESSKVTEFMRKILEVAGVPQIDWARQILLADEMFVLCCRACVKETDIKLECAIKSEENLLHLRMLAPMGGQDPLQSGQDDAGGTAANYIRTHTLRAAFEAGIDRDLLEIVSELSQQSERSEQG